MRKDEALTLYRSMLLIRRFEERCAQVYVEGKIGGFLHLYIGQEAVAVGAMSLLRPDDYFLGSYRDHGYALARGTDPRPLMAELWGRQTGISRGKGGSMHFYDVPAGNFGGDGIVGGHLPIAAGMGYAIRLRQTSDVATEQREVAFEFRKKSINLGRNTLDNLTLQIDCLLLLDSKTTLRQDHAYQQHGSDGETDEDKSQTSS